MKFSVIIPVYNTELYLKDCIESVINQEYSDFEIVLIDDASTDSSNEIIQTYKNKFNNIKFLSNKENQGQAYSRNKGIEQAEGDYVIFLDSDDLLCKGALRRIADILLEQNIDLLVYDWEIKNERISNYAERKCHSGSDYLEKRVLPGNELFSELEKNGYFKATASTITVSKKYLNRSGIRFKNGIVHEDVLFSFLCFMNAGKSMYIDEPMYIYRKRENSTTSKYGITNYISEIIVLNEIYAYWKTHTFDDQIDEAIYKFCEEIYGFIKFCSLKDNITNDIKFENKADLFAYNAIVNQNKLWHKHIIIQDYELEELWKSNIWIYGAGVRGAEVVDYLLKNGITPRGIIVSEIQSVGESILGIPIIAFNSCIYHKDDIFLIAVHKKYQPEITEKLDSNGYKYILACS